MLLSVRLSVPFSDSLRSLYRWRYVRVAVSNAFELRQQPRRLRLCLRLSANRGRGMSLRRAISRCKKGRRHSDCTSFARV